MGAIGDMIEVMNESDRKGFISYLAARNKRPDTKNISLFKDILNNDERKLKPTLGANAYNVLKKRLTDNMIDYLATITLDKEATEEVNVIRQLLAARKLFSHQKNQLAFRILRNAEVRAIKVNHYSVLNEIYQTAIQHSHSLKDSEQDELFMKYEANRDELVEQGKLNMAYAMVRKAYSKIDNEGELIDLKVLLNETYKRFNISPETGYNFTSIYQMAQMADVAGAYTKDYYAVDLFFVGKLDELEGGPLDTERHLIYHIDLLYLIANIYFRKRLFADSLKFLDKMHVQLLRFDKRYFKEKYVKYVTLYSLNLNYVGRFEESIALLDELINSKTYTFDQLLNPLMCRMMIYFQQGDLTAARNIISQFSRTDTWYERFVGKEWLLNKNFAEILLHIDLNNIDYADSRIAAIRRKLSQSKLDKIDPRIGIFLKWIVQYAQNPKIAETAEFKERIENSVEWKPREQEDIFMISFYAWLKSKMEKREVYGVTLELVELPSN